jgi:thiamine monophosphate kinase
MFRNPHSVIHVLAPDENGNEVRWAVEWAAAGALQRENVATRELLRPGDEVIIKGAPGRNPQDHKLRLNHIERPADGWTWGGSFE